MPVPSSIADLNADPSGNYPKGSDEVGTTVDDYIRAGFSIQRQLQSAEYGIPAANTLAVHPDAKTFYVTGSGVEVYAISDRATGGEIRIVFQDAGIKLINGGGLSLPAGLSTLITQTGDNGEFINDRPGHWTCVAYNTADGSSLYSPGYVKQGGDTLNGDYTVNGKLTAKSIKVTDTPTGDDAVVTQAQLNSTVNQVNTNFKKFTEVFIGWVIFWPSRGFLPSDTYPGKFLLANGQAVSRATYPVLFAKYGTFFGSGDGTTTFNLPNYLNRGSEAVLLDDPSLIARVSDGRAIPHTHPTSVSNMNFPDLITSLSGTHSHDLNIQAPVTIPPASNRWEVTPDRTPTSQFWVGTYTSGPAMGPENSTSTRTGTAAVSGTTSIAPNHAHTVSIPLHNHSVAVQANVGDRNVAAGVSFAPYVWADTNL